MQILNELLACHEMQILDELGLQDCIILASTYITSLFYLTKLLHVGFYLNWQHLWTCRKDDLCTDDWSNVMPVLSSVSLFHFWS